MGEFRIRHHAGEDVYSYEGRELTLLSKPQLARAVRDLGMQNLVLRNTLEAIRLHTETEVFQTKGTLECIQRGIGALGGEDGG